MLKFKKIMLLLLLLQGLVFADHGKYSIALGEEDKDRLLIINEIYNPFTKNFLTAPKISTGDQVLELGCGIGIISQELSKLVGPTGHVLAIDNSEEQLDVARSLLGNQIPDNLEFRKLSACKQLLPKGRSFMVSI